MIKRLLPIIVAALCAGFIVSCTPKATRVSDDASLSDKKTRASKKDKERRQTERGIDDSVWMDDRRAAEPEDDLGFARQDQTEIEEISRDDLHPEDISEEDITEEEEISEPAPVYGGKATIYLTRGFMDDDVAEMIRLNPFGDDGSVREVFKVTDSTHRRLELTLAREIRRANGRKATALDFVELWSAYMKSNPAQGLALFRNVQGAEGYVTGKDPVVNGLSAADENTIRIRLAKPDPLAFHRMISPKLIGGKFMLGAYYSGGTKDVRHRLLPNKTNPRALAAFLDECEIQTGGDADPVTSLMDGKYAIVMTSSANQLQNFESRAEDVGVTRIKLPADRYFLSCRNEDVGARKYVRSIANSAALLKLADAEGEVIGSVTTRDNAPEMPTGHVPLPQLSKSFRVAYRNDDPISTTVAEKIISDLTTNGLRVTAVGGNAEVYETALVSERYDCAVGWVPETVVENQTEKLHFASIWFADVMDPKVRISEFKEIPLFSANKYLLLRNNVKLHDDRVRGLWIVPREN